MTDTAAPRAFPLRSVVLGAAVVLAFVAAASLGSRAQFFDSLSGLQVRPHAPDLALVAAAPLPVRIHLGTALVALAVGTILMLGVKGTTLHRTLGWTWVTAMAATAISSLFIRQLNEGGFSFIHLLAGWTLVGLPMAVYAARRHQVARHRRAMMSMFFAGLLLAGLLAFLPGRLMWELFF